MKLPVLWAFCTPVSVHGWRTAVEPRLRSDFINLLVLDFFCLINTTWKAALPGWEAPCAKLTRRVETFLWAFELHHTETLIKKWPSEHTNPVTCPQPLTLFHQSCLVSFPLQTLWLCISQYIWLTWWTVRRAKLISFRVHGSHGDHLMSAPKPIWSKHYPGTADCRVGCFAVVCTCALAIDPASKSIVPHIQRPAFALVRISTFKIAF